jgi:hypothetical protein
MAYSVPNQQQYEQCLYDLLHQALDQLIDIGAHLNLHSDVLSTHEIDEEGVTTELPDVHPERLLRAQIGIEGAEEEMDSTQNLIKYVSSILITRRVRQLLQQEPTTEAV